MTNEALSWAVYLNTLPPAKKGEARPYALVAQFQAAEARGDVGQLVGIAGEAGNHVRRPGRIRQGRKNQIGIRQRTQTSAVRL